VPQAFFVLNLRYLKLTLDKILSLKGYYVQQHTSRRRRDSSSSSSSSSTVVLEILVVVVVVEVVVLGRIIRIFKEPADSICLAYVGSNVL
jgi:hypothetical protein